VTDVLCDASVVLQWFHEEGEHDVGAARALLAGHLDGRAIASILDLTVYEIGNVLRVSLGWSADPIGDQLEDLGALCAPLAPDAAELRLAAQLAEAHALTFYDAAYAAVAQSRGMRLATSDRAIVAAGVGDPPAVVAAALGLDVA